MMKTVLEVLNAGTAYLSGKDCEDARHSMQRLMAHVLQCDKTWLYLHHEDAVPEDKLVPLRELMKRRGSGEPLQHLLGTTEFYRRDFITDARALVPRPETEELVELLLKRISPRPGMRILDMGTGSGIIGITLALELAAATPDVTLADISPQALSLALENATALGAKVRTFRSDLFSAWQQEANEEHAPVPPPERFDLMVANLPYIPDAEELSAEVLHDPHTALFGGAEGTEIIERFLREAPARLAPGGIVALEIGHDQGDAVLSMMQRLGYRHAEVLADLNGIRRFPIAGAPAIPSQEP